MTLHIRPTIIWSSRPAGLGLKGAVNVFTALRRTISYYKLGKSYQDWLGTDINMGKG